jgi:hypothetical protein
MNTLSQFHLLTPHASPSQVPTLISQECKHNGDGNNGKKPGEASTPQHSLPFLLLTGDRPVGCTLLPFCPCALRCGTRVSTAQEGEGEDGEDKDGEQPRCDERRYRRLRNHAKDQADLRCSYDERERGGLQ